MSYYIVTDAELKAIADNIRGNDSGSPTYTIGEMPKAARLAMPDLITIDASVLLTQETLLQVKSTLPIIKVNYTTKNNPNTVVSKTLPFINNSVRYLSLLPADIYIKDIVDANGDPLTSANTTAVRLYPV